VTAEPTEKGCLLITGSAEQGGRRVVYSKDMGTIDVTRMKYLSRNLSENTEIQSVGTRSCRFQRFHHESNSTLGGIPYFKLYILVFF
jgi:hypothetical protein